MLTRSLRKKFLEYFQQRGHAIVPSSPTLPQNDPTLLFTNAGMNQFKEWFLSADRRLYSRAASVQKCIRVGGKHNDLDNVGHTSRHMTFFEMLGNFSFGDYGKEEAISYAWEAIVSIFELDPQKIWVSVFEKDDQAFELWRAFLPAERIVRFGDKENFWSMGETGPCGPCSEILFDRGKAFGEAKTPLEDSSGERYFECWNLVFMEFDRQTDGRLLPLDVQSIDTGLGLERLVSLKMGTHHLFQTDVLSHLIDAIRPKTSIPYDPLDSKLAPPFHVIADHLRSLSFAIADGGQPGNTERGYVLRKILRRAARYGRLLELQPPFLPSLVPSLMEVMGEDYPELKEAQDRIQEILTVEEESFARTLRKGGNILSSILEKSRRDGSQEMSGEDAFKLKDTYGFPIEEILLLAKDEGISVHLDAYQLLEEKAKERSRATGKFQKKREREKAIDLTPIIEQHGKSDFLGYSTFQREGTIIGIFADGKWVESLSSPRFGIIFLDQTPFYGEKGGQVGDIGTLSHDRAHFTVSHTTCPHPSFIAHTGTLEKGVLFVGEPVLAKIDGERRKRIAQHHSATHLLHLALEKILGSHVRQAGSLVDENHLRFDFTHHKPLSREMLREVEQFVNRRVRENSLVVTEEKLFSEVEKAGEIKQLFGEKYGKRVRVVAIGKDCKELCGGTHVDRSGSIGLFRIVKESSIGQGVRRIEAVAGERAEEFVYQCENQLFDAADLLKVRIDRFLPSLEAKIEEKSLLEAELREVRRKEIEKQSEILYSRAAPIGSLFLIAEILPLQKRELSDVATLLVQKMPAAIVCLAIEEEEQCHLFLKVGPTALALGWEAVDLVRKISPSIDGKGGGKREFAQAGGRNVKGIRQAFSLLHTLLASRH